MSVNISFADWLGARRSTARTGSAETFDPSSLAAPSGVVRLSEKCTYSAFVVNEDRLRKRMMLLYLMLFVPLATGTQTATQSSVVQEGWEPQLENSRSSKEWIADGIFNVVDNVLPATRPSFEGRRRRKKKHKLNRYIIPLIVGFMLIKSILLPIALKTLAILSGKAVVLSLMSLILAAIVGLKKVAQSHSGGGYEVVNLPVSKYKRHDLYEMGDDMGETEPYKFYRERRKRK